MIYFQFTVPNGGAVVAIAGLPDGVELDVEYGIPGDDTCDTSKLDWLRYMQCGLPGVFSNKNNPRLYDVPGEYRLVLSTADEALASDIRVGVRELSGSAARSQVIKGVDQ